MTWGFSSYETRFRWAAALWAILMTVWCMCPLPWLVRLIGGAVWVSVTVLVSLRFAWWRPRSAREIPIFLVTEALSDAVITPEHPERSLRPAELEVLIRNLLVAGYRFQTVTEALGAPARKSVVLTFDGGSRDGIGTLLPLLRQYNVKASCFVTDRGDRDARFLKPLEIQEMARSGLVEFGGYLETLETDADTLRAAVIRNRNWLTGVLGQMPKVFACPTGTDEVLAGILREAGYQTMLTEGKPMRCAQNDSFRICRMLIPRGRKPWQTYLLATRGRYHV